MRYTLVEDSRGTPYALFGVNFELMQWIWETAGSERSGAGKALCVHEDYQGPSGRKRLIDDMLLILGGGLGHDFQKAESFLEKHWHAHPQMGPYPWLGLLAEYQAGGVFHRGYRDHVAHQLKTYLLGLYLFDKCERIHQAVIGEIDNDCDRETDSVQEFRLRWLAAALAHDVGYIIENEQFVASGAGSDGPSYVQVVAELERTLKYPLARSRRQSQDTSFQKRHSLLSEEINARYPELIGFSRISHLPFCSTLKKQPRTAWAVLEPRTKHAGVWTGSNTIKDYYKFTEGHPNRFGAQYPDHGVASALILLRSWCAYANHLQQLVDAQKNRTTVQRLAENEFQWLASTTPSQWVCPKTIYAAASAMALHNIDPRSYVKGDSSNAKQSERSSGSWITDFISRLNIALDSSSGQTPLALAFLLRLCDSLQAWDRQKFRPLKSGEHLLESRDFDLTVKNNKIWIYYRGEGNDQFKTLRGDLGIALVETQVDDLVAHDDSDDNGFEFVEVFGGKKKLKSWKPTTPPVSQALFEPDEELDGKLRSLANGGRVQIGACGKPLQGPCPVRAQALHSLAEHARIGSDALLVTLVSQYLFDASNAAHALRNAEPDIIAGRLTALHRAAAYVTGLFAKPARRRASRDAAPTAASRCRDFLAHRDPQDPVKGKRAEMVQQAIWRVIKLFGDDCGQESKRKKYTKKLTVEPMASLLLILSVHGREVVNALWMLMEKRTSDVASEIVAEGLLAKEQVAKEANPVTLGGYINDRISQFPHNCDKAPRLWRRIDDEGDAA
ncbi:MAG: hypothetical protein JXA69_13720 [Phycisphaerae bacterium]|nr:hypothetical protein [Phycisphaerae bacterium]